MQSFYSLPMSCQFRMHEAAVEGRGTVVLLHFLINFVLRGPCSSFQCETRAGSLSRRHEADTRNCQIETGLALKPFIAFARSSRRRRSFKDMRQVVRPRTCLVPAGLRACANHASVAPNTAVVCRHQQRLFNLMHCPISARVRRVAFFGSLAKAIRTWVPLCA